MIILGIETSCDETAAAVVTGDRQIKSNIIHSQLDEHQQFGGVVPEVAARAHMNILDHLVSQALQEAKIGFEQLDGIAVAGGPGLIGGVITGVMMAKSIAAVHDLPFIAVNHLAGHALTARLTNDVEFPYLLLLVSGGHCQLLVVRSADDFELLGTTLDDAVGEAFDKSARLLNLPYPGGPAIEQCAKNGDGNKYKLPRPLLTAHKQQASGCNFSFSGLKTAVRQLVHGKEKILDQDVADICASFQFAVGDVLSDRCHNALKLCEARSLGIKCMVVAGGVAANQYLRERIAAVSANSNIEMVAPPADLCTDNAAMIAWAGIERLQLGLTDAFEFAPRPRWPLDKNRK